MVERGLTSTVLGHVMGQPNLRDGVVVGADLWPPGALVDLLGRSLALTRVDGHGTLAWPSTCEGGVWEVLALKL